MEDYKGKINRRMAFMAMSGVLIVILYWVAKQTLEAPKQIGFITGLCIALEALILGYLAKLFLSSRSASGLKKLAISEGDERKALIAQKTSRAGIVIYAVGIGIATIAAFFINETVFMTLMGVLTFMALIKIILRVYFQRKY